MILQEITVPTPAYIRTEVFDDGQGVRTRGYVQADTDPRFLALVARDALKALENRGISTQDVLDCIEVLSELLAAWGIMSAVHPESGTWIGERLSDWES